MLQTLSYEPFWVCYRTKVVIIFRGNRIYMEVRHATKCEVLEAAPDIRKKQKTTTNMSLVFIRKIFWFIPIKISSLCFHSPNHNVENKIKSIITGTHHQEIGLDLPTKFVFLTEDWRSCEIRSKISLTRQGIYFPTFI